MSFWNIVRSGWRAETLRRGPSFRVNAAETRLKEAADVRRVLERRVRELEADRVNDLPGLTPAEIERLAMLAEECGEVIQAVGKVLRHGWESQSPYGGKPNRVALERELGDVRAVVNLMLDAEDVRLAEIQTWQRSKRKKIPAWTHHQADSVPGEEQLAMMQKLARAIACRDEVRAQLGLER